MNSQTGLRLIQTSLKSVAVRTKSPGANILLPFLPAPCLRLDLTRQYATTPAGVKTTYPSSATPAEENSSHHKHRHGYEQDQGYLAFTKSSLFKLTLPLQPPSPDPDSPSSKSTSAKARAERHQDANPSQSEQHERDEISSQPWEEAAETSKQPVSQVNYRPHHNLHGAENGEPSDVEADEYDAEAPAHSVVFLLHSGQPLSYVASLIRAEGPSPEPSAHQREQVDSGRDADVKVQPHRLDKRPKLSEEKEEIREMLLREGFLDPLGDPPISFHTRAADGKRWSPATGIGDFLRDAARIGSFVIRIGDRNVSVTVPSFEDRTRFLRASLYAKTDQIESLVKLKRECDEIAHSGTKRLSFVGVAILASWWGSVAFLTFFTELGWDVMEPVTYLTGLGTILGGYVWFLIHNREVSYRAVLNETTSRRQQRLYVEKGFNIERYQDLIEEAKELRKTIKKVAEDYDLEWDQSETRAGKQTKHALKIIQKHEAATFTAKSKDSKDEESSSAEQDTEDKDGDGQPDNVQDDKAKLKTKPKKSDSTSQSTRGLHTSSRPRSISLRRSVQVHARCLSSSTRADSPMQKSFSIKPYLQLSRIDKPIGTWLLFWPCAWSIVLASHTMGLAASTPIFYTLLFAVGALVMRGAGCTINDMWDAKMDRMVERTKDRPLAAGDVTQFQALCFLGIQLSAGLAVLVNLNLYSILLGASSLSVVVLYPLMKRLTYWPQLVLGFAFNWGAMLGWSAVAGMVNWPVVLPLYVGSIFWTLIYDTIYAHQDKNDDVKAGVKSTALLFADRTKPVLSAFSCGTIGLFGYSASQSVPVSAATHSVGNFLSLGLTPATIETLGSFGVLAQHHPFFSVGLAAASAHLAWQIGTVNLESRQDCWAKFCSNTTFGWIVFGGLVADYSVYLYVQRQNQDKNAESGSGGGDGGVGAMIWSNRTESMAPST